MVLLSREILKNSINKVQIVQIFPVLQALYPQYTIECRKLKELTPESGDGQGEQYKRHGAAPRAPSPHRDPVISNTCDTE